MSEIGSDKNKMFNDQMLRLARGSRGETQSNLSGILRVSQGKFSKWEDGLLTPSRVEVKMIANYLRYPVDFFYSKEDVSGFGSCCLYHRKRQSLPVKTLSMIHDQINVLGIGVSRLLKNVNIETPIEFHRLDIDDYKSPEVIARAVRSMWMLPLGPIRSLVQVIEAAGGIVVPFHFGTEKLSAVSLWPRKSPPLFFINTQQPADRWRFTLAHELGHIIMHRIPSPDAEKEADLFASEFLMPSDEVVEDLSGLNLASAASLKHKWRVSMQALIMKAKDTGAITPRKHKSLFTQLSKLGYRKKEPETIEQEYPTILKQLYDVHIQDLGYTMDDLVKLTFCVGEDQFRKRYLPEESQRFRIVR